MRLKGGKVLISSVFEIGSDDVLPLDEQLVKAILEKGVAIKIKCGNLVYIHDVCFNWIDSSSEEVLSETLTLDDGSTLGITLNIDSKTISVLTD